MGGKFSEPLPIERLYDFWASNINLVLCEILELQPLFLKRNVIPRLGVTHRLEASWSFVSP